MASAAIPLGLGAVAYAAAPAETVECPLETTSALHPDQTFAIYGPPYGASFATRGSVRGEIQFPDSPMPAGDAVGVLEWFKPAIATEDFFPAGLTLRRNALLARYVRPERGTRVLALDPVRDNGHLVLADGCFAPVDAPTTR